MMSEIQRRTVGLALGGGGARGMAHIGVLRVLQREGIPIDFIAGTSIGAIIGAAYAAGMQFEQIEGLWARTRDRLRVMDVRLTGQGLFRGTRLYRQFTELLGEGLTFADLHIPLEVMATDLKTGREVVLCEGLVADAIRASMSVPGAFEPVELNEMMLADGGLLNNVPVDALYRAKCNVKIAIDVLPNFPQNRPGEPPVVVPIESGLLPAAMKQVMNAVLIMMAEITEYKLTLCPPDVIIRPELPARVSLLSGFERSAEVIAAGEAATEKVVPEVRRLVNG